MAHKDTSLAIKQAIYQSQMMGIIQCSKCHAQGHKPNYKTRYIFIPNDGDDPML